MPHLHRTNRLARVLNLILCVVPLQVIPAANAQPYEPPRDRSSDASNMARPPRADSPSQAASAPYSNPPAQQPARQTTINTSASLRTTQRPYANLLPCISNSPAAMTYAYLPVVLNDAPTATLFHTMRAGSPGGQSGGCALYPIAVHEDSLKHIATGTVVSDIANGTQPGNFGWLSWAGGSGERAHMTDASGVTSYTYDLGDRLTSKATPWGTLSYTYDANGNLRAIHASNANGASAEYAYDALNRRASVRDNNLASGTTTYAYDENGNLAGYEYPNQTRTSYTYDKLNRLTAMNIARPGMTLASYAYTLGPAGNRTAVAEQNGRKMSYTYDNLYRLTNETISGAAAGANGAVGYEYDAVGNRLRRRFTLSAVPPTTSSYDANDRLASDTYDANGNTIASDGHTYAYDFENHLVGMDNGAVTYVYDGDGNRVAKTVGGVTTYYLVDDRNPTGYAQVQEEIVGGAVARSYLYGLGLISQRQASGVSFYGYDGHGSVRFLTDAAGLMTDQYDYDAFGILIGSTGTTANSYLYSGEQYDSNLELQYLRARYMKAETGRFWTMDAFEGNAQEPVSLHKYVSFRWQTSEALFTKPYSLHPYQYAYSNPVLHTDPTGKCVPDEDSPRACNPTFTRSIRDFLQYSYRYENRNYSGGDPINLILDRFTEDALIYRPENDQQLRAFLDREGFDVEATIGYLNIRLTQWRMNYAQQHNATMPDLGPLASGLIILGVAAGGPDCFLSPDGGGGGASAGYIGPERQLTGGPPLGGVAPQQYPKSIPPSAGRHARGNAGQAALEALYGPNGRRGVRFNTSRGDRFPDYVVEEGGRIYAHESSVQAHSVRAGSFKIREALKDGELKRTIPGYTPIWHFWDGGPQAELARILRQEGITYIVYNR